MSKMTTCSKCGGSGVLDYCGRCNGSGTVSCSTCGGSGEIGDNCRACGGSGRISRTRLKNCSHCHGSGREPPNGGFSPNGACIYCGGSGQVEDEYEDICPNCNGVGKFSTHECRTCNGTGKITCPTCHGNAHTRSTCNRCDGTGKVEVSSFSSSSSEEGKWWEAVLGLLALIVLCWGGWRGYKWLFEKRGGEVITEAEIMEKWEEHLEKRREAFDDGKPEREIEEKGLRNYTWDEWKERFKKELEAQEKEEGSGKTRAQEIGEQAMSSAKELGGKAKSLWQDFTSNSVADLWREHQDKRRTLINQGISEEAVEKIGYEALSFDEFKARYKDKDAEAELKKLNARADELIKERKNAAHQRTVPAVTRSEKPIASARPATMPAKTSSRNEATARAKADAVSKAKAATEAAKAAAEGAVSGQQNGTGQKASKDSKSIRTVVQGKGKTKEAALHYAFRRAVWNTVGTWVGSKTRIEENRAQVIALVETITEADIRKYEVMETKQQDGNIFVKVRVSVSKKQIAPKFAKVFPDVFANE